MLPTRDELSREARKVFLRASFEAISWPAFAAGALTALLALTGFAFVHGNRANIPMGDEILWLPYVTGELPVTARWLWSPHNDHRLVIPKLLYLGLWHLRPHSFKLAMYFGFTCLVLATIAMLIVSARLRGTSSYFDCLFPLLFLNPGHAENFLSGYNSVCNVVTATSIVILIVLVMLDRELESGAARIGAIAIAVCLPFTTGTGAIVAVPASAALAYAGVRAYRKGAPASRRAGATLCVAAVVVLGIVALYAASGRHQSVAPASVKSMILNSLKVIAMSFGPFLQEEKQYWPYFFGLIAAAGALALLSSSRKVRDDQGSRVRLAMLWAIVSGYAAGAAAVGYSRTYLGIDAGLQTRYSLLWAPMICCIYLAISIAASVGFTGFVHFVLFLAAAASFGKSSDVGRLWRDERNAYFDDIAAGVRMGWTQEDLVDATRMRRFVYPDPAFFDEFFRRLRQASLAPFDGSRDAFAAFPSSPDTRGATLRGQVDACAYDGTAYKISGWAVCDHAPPVVFMLIIDGRRAIATSDHQSRFDVEQAIGTRNAGFLLIAPPRVEGKKLVVGAICAEGGGIGALPETAVTCSSRSR